MPKKNIQLGTMGMKALESHAKLSKHIKSTKGKYKTPSIAGVFQPSNVSQLAASATSPPATTATTVDLRAGL